MKRQLSIIIKLTVSLLFILAIIYSVDIKEIIKTFSNIQYGLLVWLIPLIPLSIFTRIYRWRFLMNYKSEKKLSIGFSTKITLAGLALNIFMPAQSGEVLKSYYGYKWSGIKERMVSVSLYDKLIALGSIGFLGIIPAIYNANIWFFLGSIVAFLPIIFLYVSLKQKFLKKAASKLINKLFKNKINFDDLIRHFNFSRAVIFQAVIISIVSWFVTYTVLWVCFLSVLPFNEFAPPLLYVLMIAPILTLARLFPLTLNGFGSDEAVTVIIFNIIGIPVAVSLGAAIIYKLLLIIAPGFVGIIIILFTKNNRKTIH